MDIELHYGLRGKKKQLWKDFLTRAGLEADENIDRTVLIWEEDTLAATGSRKGNLLKCIAVDDAFQGQGLTATVLTQLRQDAFAEGYSHLFLYTKPKNLLQFQSLFFYPVAQTEQVLLMEDMPQGISQFLGTLKPVTAEGRIGALVMNCNPFTLGHRYVIETAAKECDHVYVFVLSEEQPPFPAADRLQLVKAGTGDLKNVTVFPTGPYLISSATFPTYFLKDRDQAVTAQCGLDIAVFSRYYIPKFGITHRYVGTEPTSALTNAYNHALKAQLPIPVVEISRLEAESAPISASTVRSLLGTGQPEAVRKLVPATTFDYLEKTPYYKGGNPMQERRATHILSSYYAPRGHIRMYALGMQLAQMYLSPTDKLIGIIGEAGSGKSALIRGMFPGLELTNDDNGVYVRPLPLLEMDNGFAFFSPHTYHVDIRFENGFTQMTVLADAIAEALRKGKRVVVEHFDLVYPLLGYNANILIAVGEQVMVARPNLFGPEPEELRKVVYESLHYRLMAHTAEDLCEMFISDFDESRCGHDDVKHGFCLYFPDTPPEIDIPKLEKQVQDIIAEDLPITYVDENHISVGGNIQKCSGPRIHVAHTGQVENFHLLPQLIHDPFKRRYLLVGCVGENSEELLQSLDMMRQHPAWD